MARARRQPLEVESVPPDAQVMTQKNPHAGFFAHSASQAKAMETRMRKPESWANVVRRITSMTPQEIAEEYGEVWLEKFSKYGTRALRELMVLRAAESFLQYPTAQMFNALTDREDGKVPQTAQGELNINIRDWRVIAEKMGVSEGEIIEELQPIIRELALGPGNTQSE